MIEKITGGALPNSKEVIGFLNELFNTNANFTCSHDSSFFKDFTNGQSPKLIIVKCSDSRVQMESFDSTPQNNVFAIRNIGNQIKTCEGSVDFGVTILNTPFLLIIGHSDCGAVTAVVNKTQIDSEAIRKELSTIKVEKSSIIEATLENIGNQVDFAVAKYQDRINAYKLTVMGAFYDFRNDLGFGHGTMVMTNINGLRSPKLLNDFYADEVENFRTLMSNQVI